MLYMSSKNKEAAILSSQNNRTSGPTERYTDDKNVVEHIMNCVRQICRIVFRFVRNIRSIYFQVAYSLNCWVFFLGYKIEIFRNLPFRCTAKQPHLILHHPVYFQCSNNHEVQNSPVFYGNDCRQRGLPVIKKSMNIQKCHFNPTLCQIEMQNKWNNSVHFCHHLFLYISKRLNRTTNYRYQASPNYIIWNSERRFNFCQQNFQQNN